MSLIKYLKLGLVSLLGGCLALTTAGCITATGTSEYFGVTEPPPNQVLRYVTGAEPESLDPQRSTGQPEARIYMALYEGLTEYDAKTLKPTPALAERWESNKDLTEHTFYLRKNARWSDGTPITAEDFVYSLRRGLDPVTASQTAELAYPIKYAEAYNAGHSFIQDPATKKFLLVKDLKEEPAIPLGQPTPTPTPPLDEAALRRLAKRRAEQEEREREEAAKRPPESEFHKFINSETRATVPSDEKKRIAFLQENPRLQKLATGKNFVPIKAADVGIEAVDKYTVRITLTQSSPYFLAATPHQFFRLVPRATIEKYGDKWTQPQNIVTCGPFRVKEWLPYNHLIVERDPNYWDAANVKLNRIEFYPVEENPTIMNLYKTGAIDAALNHSVPNAWLAEIPKYKDYMGMPEASNEFIKINTTRPPMDRSEVRKAFNLAIDKNAYAAWRRVVLPLTGLTPQGIFPDYPQPKGDQFNPEAAKRLLLNAGYGSGGNYDPAKFPVSEVEIIYNSNDTNKAVAEFIQAQWRQNLGITVPLRAMEWQTFLQTVKAVEYKGFARGAWSADYMDPYTFLGLFYNKDSNGDSGWEAPAYKQMLDEANRQLDQTKRYATLARAEAYLLNAQPFIPLATASTNFMKKPYLKGFYPNPGSFYPWKQVYIEYDPAKWDTEPPKLSD